MKNKVYKIITSLLLSCLVFCPAVNTEASDTDLYFPSEDIVQAYYNLLLENQDAIRAIHSSETDPENQIDEVSIYDINADGVNELIFESDSETDGWGFFIYTYADGQMYQIMKCTMTDFYSMPDCVFMMDPQTLWITFSGGADVYKLIFREETYNASTHTLEEEQNYTMVNIYSENVETGEWGFQPSAYMWNDEIDSESHYADFINEITTGMYAVVWRYGYDENASLKYISDYSAKVRSMESYGMSVDEALDALQNHVILQYDGDAEDSTFIDPSAPQEQDEQSQETDGDAEDSTFIDPSDTAEYEFEWSGWMIAAAILIGIASIATVVEGVLLFVVYFKMKKNRNSGQPAMRQYSSAQQSAWSAPDQQGAFRSASVQPTSVDPVHDQLMPGRPVNVQQKPVQSTSVRPTTSHPANLQPARVQSTSVRPMTAQQKPVAPIQPLPAQAQPTPRPQQPVKPVTAQQMPAQVQPTPRPQNSVQYTPANPVPAQAISVPPVHRDTPQKEFDWLTADRFIIDEKVTAFEFENSYKIYSPAGELAGFVQQDQISGGAVASRVLMGKSSKLYEKFRLVLYDRNKQKIGCIYREGGSFSNYFIENASGKRLLVGKMRFGALQDDNGKIYCKLAGLINMKLSDENGNQLAIIHHKWNGAKSIFTTADKYLIEIDPQLTGEFRQIIVSVAVAYDMIMGDI